MLTGTGTAGAYHAGVLRALNEAGVKVDLVAGMGVGAVAALYSAVDGGPRLWDSGGVWRGGSPGRFYGPDFRRRATHAFLALTLVLLAIPLLVPFAAGLLWIVAFLLNLVTAGGGEAPAAAAAELMLLTRAPEGLTTIFPRLVTLALALAALVLALVWAARRLRSAGIPGRRTGVGAAGLGPPFTADSIEAACAAGLWNLMRGAASIGEPARKDLSRRYTELLGENIGQPGFRELLILTHDLDTRRDLVFAFLAEPFRRRFFGRTLGVDTDRRLAETIDLSGTGREHALDALAGALRIVPATAPHPMAFSAEGFWRGETHRLCSQAAGLGRILDELSLAGVEQAIVISATTEIARPHMLAPARRDERGRLGEQLTTLEVTDFRDAVSPRRGRFRGLFQIRSLHNPIGPFDFTGAYDPRSDRRQTLGELVDRGYEDAYRQFIDPVVGASGERMMAPITEGKATITPTKTE